MMDAAQIALPILGILGAAALTFYAVSFAELKEKSFKDLGDEEDYGSEEATRWKSSLSSRERRFRRKANKEEERKR